MNWIIVDTNGQQVAGGFTSKEEANKTKQSLQESTGQSLKVTQVLLG